MSNHSAPHYSIVIPAFNEAKRIRPPLERSVEWLRDRGRPFEIIVSDDGSSDETTSLVERLRTEIPELRLVRSPVNRGKGHAVRVGVEAASGSLVLLADADGATPIDQLAVLEAAIVAGGDVAIGSRAHADNVERRWYRHLIGRSFHLLVRLFGTRGIRDTQCGFKLFTAASARDLFSRARINGFSFDVEILLLAQHLGYRIAEVPVAWVHQPGSRINLVTDSMRMALDLIVIRVRALRGIEPVVASGSTNLANPRNTA
jgi:dolichyl-phosphate beta-glucosyltransferase